MGPGEREERQRRSPKGVLLSTILAVAFTPAPAKQNPNLRKTDDAGASATYYRSIFVTLASARRWNGQLDLVLVTDASVPQPYRDRFASLGTRAVEAPFDHRPPIGFWPTFNASLYTIDAMVRLSRDAGATTKVLLVDPDVLCTGLLDPVFERVHDRTILVYPTGFPDYEKSQGLNAFEAASLHQRLEPDLVDIPVHYGGELYGFTTDGCRSILKRTEDAWRLAMADWVARRPHFVTEEHLLNYALRRASVVDGSMFIRRIWTAPVYRTVRGDEGGLLLWHLPAEKDRGIAALAAPALDRSSWFWRVSREEFLRRCGRVLGIPN